MHDHRRGGSKLVDKKLPKASVNQGEVWWGKSRTFVLGMPDVFLASPLAGGKYLNRYGMIGKRGTFPFGTVFLIHPV